MVPPKSSLFELELDGETLIVTPTHDLGEFGMYRFDEEAPTLLRFWNESATRNVVVDFHRTDYFGSTTLGLLVKVHQFVKKRGGKMVICGVSRHENEVFLRTRLDSLWPICPSRDEALALVEARPKKQTV
jgi:anti-anti-sigma factor